MSTTLDQRWIAALQGALGKALPDASEYREIRAYGSLEKLQDATKAELERIARLYVGFFSNETSPQDLVEGQELWLAGVLGAAIAAFEGRLPGVSFGPLPDDLDGETRRSELVELYGALLSGVCSAFTQFAAESLSLDQLLTQHVDELPDEAADLVGLVAGRRKDFQELLESEGLDMNSISVAGMLLPWRLVEAALSARFGARYSDELKLATAFALVHMSDEKELRNRLRVAPDRMRGLVSEKYATMTLYAFWSHVEEFAALLAKATYEAEAARIERVATAFGRPEAAESIFRSTVLAPRPGTAPEQFAADVARMVAAAPDERLIDTLEAGTKLAVDEGNATHISLVGAALDKVQLKPSARADALVWLSSRLRALHEPRQAITLLGVQAAAWEAQLSDEIVAVIELERSRLLYDIGSLEEAWDAMLKATKCAATANSVRWRVASAIQHAVLLRAIGRLSEARLVLEDTVAVAEEGQRAQALRTLAIVLAELGMNSRAADTMAQARASRGAVMSRSGLWGDLAAETAYRFNAGQIERAQALMQELTPLEELPLDLLTTTLPIFSLASAHSPDGHWEMAGSALVNRSLREAEALAARGATRRARDLRRAALAVASKIAPARRWEILDVLESDNTTTREPDVAVHALERACLSGDADAISEALVSWRLGLARAQGGAERRVHELDGAAALGQMLQESFGRIWREGSCPPPVLQIVNDAQRNLLQRASWLRQRLARTDEHAVLETFQTMVPHEASRFVEVGLAPFAVLEWLEAPESFVALVTRVNADGLEHTFPGGFDVDIVRLAEELTFELSALTPALSGPAFGSPEWSTIRRWMESVLKAALPDGGHLVIIDQAGLYGLPLHVAVPQGWTASYAADWTAVVEAARQGSAPKQPAGGGRLALTHVLGATEAVRTAEAVTASDLRLRAAAEAIGWSTEQLSGSDADADAICDQLARVDAMRLIAHGFVLGETREVALIVAAGGRLPPRSGAAFDAVGMDRYRLGFDRLATLERAPGLIFLGACSAGRINERGRQERLGLFLPLSAIGAEAMIAPRWPIHAPRTLPLLDRIVERYLSGMAPAQAVSYVSAEAAREGSVDWVAHAFCVEGRWT